MSGNKKSTKESKVKKQRTSFPCSTFVRDKILHFGRKDENYDQVLERLLDNPYGLDEGVLKQMKETSKTMGIEMKTLVEVGSMIVIFLVSSGAMQQLQSVAMSKHKPVVTVLLEILKRLKF